MTTAAPARITALTLTLLQLNPRSRAAARDLRDTQGMHRTLTGLLAADLTDEASPRARHGLLHRVERDATGVRVLVQSAEPLDPSRLPTGYLAADPQTRDLAPLLNWLSLGLTVRYRIDASPTRCTPPTPLGGGRFRRGARRPLFGQAATDWWSGKAQAAGLDVLDVSHVSLGPATGNRDGRRVTTTLTRYEGIATVTDPETLRQVIGNGIGTGRAYGAGLLSIAPA